MNDNFVNIIKDINKKLNALNSDIVFYYYMKYKTMEFSPFVDISKSIIDFKGYYYSIDEPMTDEQKFDFVAKTFPYYYKSLNLYAHLNAILDLTDIKNLASTYLNVIGNFVANGDNIYECTSELIEDAKLTFDFTPSTEAAMRDMKRINLELKILMRNANNLHKDFKKYGDDIEKFLKDSKLDDYLYLCNEAEEKNKRNANFRDMDDDDDTWSMGQQIKQPETHPSIIPSANTSFVIKPKTLDEELQMIKDLYEHRMMSRGAYKKACGKLISQNRSKNLNNISLPPTQAPKYQYNKNVEDMFKKLQTLSDSGLDKEMIKKMLGDTIND